MYKIIVLSFILFPLFSSAQFSFRAGAAIHNDYFGTLDSDERESYFTRFQQYVAGSAYRSGAFRIGMEVSWLQASEHLEGNFGQYFYGSHGGQGYSHQDTRKADAAFSYLGFRLAADFDLAGKSAGKGGLFLSVSQHCDVLTSEKYTNKLQTTSVYYSGDPPSVPPELYTPPGYAQEPETKSAEFPVLELDKFYCYTSLGLKPWVKIGPVHVELELAAGFFMQPRVVNKLKSPYGDDNEEQYKARRLFGTQVAVANEIGFRLAYVLKSNRNRQ